MPNLCRRVLPTSDFFAPNNSAYFIVGRWLVILGTITSFSTQYLLLQCQYIVLGYINRYPKHNVYLDAFIYRRFHHCPLPHPLILSEYSSIETAPVKHTVLSDDSVRPTLGATRRHTVRWGVLG